VLLRRRHAAAGLAGPALNPIHQLARAVQLAVVGLLQLLQVAAAAAVTARSALPLATLGSGLPGAARL
jgi:hypothetical protein